MEDSPSELWKKWKEGEEIAEQTIEEIMELQNRIFLACVKKMTIPELKTYMKENRISLPQRGSGKNGNFIRSDYIDAIEESELK